VASQYNGGGRDVDARARAAVKFVVLASVVQNGRVTFSRRDFEDAEDDKPASGPGVQRTFLTLSAVRLQDLETVRRETDQNTGAVLIVGFRDDEGNVQDFLGDEVNRLKHEGRVVAASALVFGLHAIGSKDNPALSSYCTRDEVPWHEPREGDAASVAETAAFDFIKPIRDTLTSTRHRRKLSEACVALQASGLFGVPSEIAMAVLVRLGNRLFTTGRPSLEQCLFDSIPAYATQQLMARCECSYQCAEPSTVVLNEDNPHSRYEIRDDKTARNSAYEKPTLVLV